MNIHFLGSLKLWHASPSDMVDGDTILSFYDAQQLEKTVNCSIFCTFYLAISIACA
ncbi:MAG: hypothetical protein IJR46_02520 [Neisseriaceae bacterium]|nr:hypothetical protein [Neisseriaceae bacterium]